MTKTKERLDYQHNHVTQHPDFMPHTQDLLNIFLSSFTILLPTLIVSLVAGVVIFTKWRQASSASFWALLGFSLALILCFAIPLGNCIIQPWIFESGGDMKSRIWAFRAFAIAASVLQAITYAFLLVAIFAERHKPDATISLTTNKK